MKGETKSIIGAWIGVLIAVGAVVAAIFGIVHLLKPKPYEIWTIDDFYDACDPENVRNASEIKLMASLDFENSEYQTMYLEKLAFNGNGYTLNNITVNSYQEFDGLFQAKNYEGEIFIYDLSIENLTFNYYFKDQNPTLFDGLSFDNVHIRGDVFIPYADSFGGFVTVDKFPYKLTFKNCSSSLNINGGKNVAGFLVFDNYDAGNSRISFENCISNCTISSSRNAAGFFVTTNTKAYNANFTNCVNEGEIESTGAAGGISTDIINTTFTTCTNKGSVVSGGEAGGIASSLSYGLFDRCVNDGHVEGDYNVGGILGTGGEKNCAFDGCINNGTVVSKDPQDDSFANLGGIVGRHTVGTIANCVNNAEITSKYAVVGGIAGECKGNLIRCVNNANITADTAVGGIVGLALSGIKINSCVNNGDVKGDYMAGGILGGAGPKKSTNIFSDIFPSNGMVVDVLYCESYGKISARNYAGGIIGLLYSCVANAELIETNRFSGTITCGGISDVIMNKK